MNFIINLKNNIIEIKNYNDDIILKREGEETFLYDNSFWEWFKGKIGYDNEELSFIIITDKKQFLIDEKIKIPKVSGFKVKPKLIISKNLNLFSYPPLELMAKKIIKTNKNTLLDFFIDETNKIKG